MKISVVGTGYVGLVSGACFSDMGHDVICVDIDQKKIAALKKGIIPIYEPGLEEMVKRNHNKTLEFTTDLAYALQHSKVCFIAVGTPMQEDGRTNLNYVFNVAKTIGETMVDTLYVINKSTVPVGTAVKVKAIIEQALLQREASLAFEVISNPEFLKEGDAINDFMKPDRIVIGASSNKAFDVMKALYASFTRNHDRLICMDIPSAEMTKYAANAMLATKISFMNEMANICERLGANINHVRQGIGSDSRIGYAFIYPGCGYGGSCFPKDVASLYQTSNDLGYRPKILEAVQQVNAEQKELIVQKIKQHFAQDSQEKEPLKNHQFSIWGLSFKPQTDDMREAPSITVIKALVALGARLKVYDPQASYEAIEYYLQDIPSQSTNKAYHDRIKHHGEIITYYDNKYDALNQSDALVLLTEWKEFRNPDFYEIEQRLKHSILFDGRNQYDEKKLQQMNFEYFQIGVCHEKN